MNAYELADYVDARERNNPHLKAAANRIRQQADLLKKYETRNVELQAKITKLLTRMAELEARDYKKSMAIRFLNKQTKRLADLCKQRT